MGKDRRHNWVRMVHHHDIRDIRVALLDDCIVKFFFSLTGLRIFLHLSSLWICTGHTRRIMDTGKDAG